MGFAGLVRTVWRETFRQNHSGRAAQIAYYAIFSTPPLLILILAASTLLPVGGLLESFTSAIEVGLPFETAELLKEQMQSLPQSTNWGLIGGALLLLGWSGSGVFLILGVGLDAAFGIEQRRHAVRERLLSVLMSYTVFASLVLVMILLVFGPRVARLILEETQALRYEGELYHFIRWSIAAGFMLFASSILFALAPNVSLGWRLLTPGSIFAALTWVAATIGLDLYVDQFGRYQETYGALCGIIVLLMWFHLTGFLILVGGTIDGAIYQAVSRTNPPQS